MNSTNSKMLMAGILFAAWFALVIFQVAHADAIITFIQCSLTGLGGYHAGDRGTAAPESTPVGHFTVTAQKETP